MDTTETTQIVTLDPTTLDAVPVPAAVAAVRHDPAREPIRLLADRREGWTALRRHGRAGGPAFLDRPLTWQEARARIEASAAEDGARTDLGAGALDRLAVDYDGSGVLHVAKTQQIGGRLAPASAAIPLRAHAFRQLAERADAPAEYLARIPATLARACLLHGLGQSGANKTGMIRLARGEARAIVSGRYGIADDSAVLDATEEALRARGLLDAVRVAALATGARTVLRLTLPWERDAVGRPGDRIVSMLDVRNGELGNASTEIRGGAYRIVCTNGLVAPVGAEDVRRVRHVGDSARLAEQLYDALPAAIDAAQGTTDLLAQATARIVGDAASAFDGLRLFGAPAGLVSAAVEVYAAEHGHALPADTAGRRTILEHVSDVTAWDVANAVTDAAQRLGTEARLGAEDIAGRYLRRTMGA